MCGRYQPSSSAEEIVRWFKTTGPLPNTRPRYNAAPTQSLPIVLRDHESGERRRVDANQQRGNQRVGTLWIGLMILCLSGMSAQAAVSAPLPECKTDNHGKLYIALDPYVFAIPENGVGVVGGIYPQKLTPRDATEPVGCPDNPNQLTSYALVTTGVTGLTDDWGLAKNAHPSALALQLIRVPRGTKPLSSDEITKLDGLQVPLIRQECAGKWSVHESLSFGLDACRAPIKGASKENWPVSYIARTDVYTTPFGNPFGILCLSSPLSQCYLDYLIRPEIRIAYYFDPFVTISAIPIDHIFDFDRALRKNIEDWIVEDYEWPPQVGLFSDEPTTTR